MKSFVLFFSLVAGAFAQSGIINVYDSPLQMMQRLGNYGQQSQPYFIPTQPLPQAVPMPQMQPVAPSRMPESYTSQRIGNTGYIRGSQGTYCTVNAIGQFTYTNCF